MVVTTWLDRITDESNVWLSAIKAEEAEQYEEAATIYLEDSSLNLEKGSLVRAALSCSCAANCLAKAGIDDISTRLYFEAGLLYEECAEDRMAVSIRESIWALQRAYVCFVQANDAKEADAARESLDRLEKRANPFVTGEDKLGVLDLGQLVMPKKKGSSPRPDGRLREALDLFFATRRKESRPRASSFVMSDHRGEDLPDEESIASQLG